MLVYYLILVLVAALCVPLCIYKPTKQKNIVFLCIVFGYLFLLSVLREGIGFDYYRYIEMFDLARQPMGSDVTADIGFEMILRLFALLHLPNRVVFGVLAAWCLVPVAVFIGKYSPNVALSTWLYVTLTFFYGTMNFVRQNMALAILLMAWPLLRDGRWRAHVLYLLVVALAFFVHSTVIIMVPVILLLHIPLNKITAAVVVAADVLGVVFAQQLLNLFALRADGEYYFLNYHVDSFYLVGLSWKFLVLPVVFGLLCLALHGRIAAQFADGDIVVKMMLISAVIWSFVIRFFILERFSLFTYCYCMLALPYALAVLRPAGLPAGTVLSEAQKRVRITAWLPYAAALCVVLGMTFAYNRFGMYDAGTGFHGVFPYRSYVEAINYWP